MTSVGFRASPSNVLRKTSFTPAAYLAWASRVVPESAKCQTCASSQLSIWLCSPSVDISPGIIYKQEQWQATWTLSWCLWAFPMYLKCLSSHTGRCVVVETIHCANLLAISLFFRDFQLYKSKRHVSWEDLCNVMYLPIHVYLCMLGACWWLMAHKSNHRLLFTLTIMPSTK